MNLFFANGNIRLNDHPVHLLTAMQISFSQNPSIIDPLPTETACTYRRDLRPNILNLIKLHYKVRARSHADLFLKLYRKHVSSLLRAIKLQYISEIWRDLCSYNQLHPDNGILNLWINAMKFASSLNTFTFSAIRCWYSDICGRAANAAKILSGIAYASESEITCLVSVAIVYQQLIKPSDIERFRKIWLQQYGGDNIVAKDGFELVSQSIRKYYEPRSGKTQIG